MSGRHRIGMRFIVASHARRPRADGADARARRRNGRPRPVGEHRQGLAERQSQRQQQPLPGGRHRPVPPRPRGSQSRQPLDPYRLRLHRRRAQGVRLSRDLERDQRRRKGVHPERRRHLVDVPEPARLVERRDPVRQLQGERSVRLGRREVFGRPAPPDDLGRDDHVDRSGRRTPGTSMATAPPTSSSASARPDPPSSWRGVAISRNHGIGTPPAAGHAMARRSYRVRRGTCGRSSSMAQATRTRTAASNRAPSSGSCRLRPLATRPPSRRHVRRPTPLPPNVRHRTRGRTRPIHARPPRTRVRTRHGPAHQHCRRGLAGSSGGAGLVYVAFVMAGLVAISVLGARRARSRARPPD